MVLHSSKLSNGLRVITDSVDAVESVAIGVWCDVGTRHEDLQYNGVAHMVEHMMFNGTETRTAQEIVGQIESVGGQMNAYTSRELTAYYVHLLKECAPMALDILSDMIQHSIFPESEVEKERDVILQEIGMTLDTPDDLVFDLYQETAYPGQSIGAPILGTSDIIQKMQRDVMQDYVRRFYTADKLVVSAAGNIAHEDVVKLCEKYFTDLAQPSNENYVPANYKGGEKHVEKKLEQTHIVLGYQAVSKQDSDYYAAILLSTIMGGGMSSRLFQEVREKRGLVYSVYTSHTAYHDDGQFEVYAGTGPDKVNELMPVLRNEIEKISHEPVLEDELVSAKNQMKSGILMGRESMLSRANRQAKYMINFDRELNIADVIAKIDAVSVKDIQAVAQRIFNSKQPTLSVLGGR
jgi:predicted Zn-dependent peptidase